MYLDAFVPEDGDSCWSMTNDREREWTIRDATHNLLKDGPDLLPRLLPDAVGPPSGPPDRR